MNAEEAQKNVEKLFDLLDEADIINNNQYTM